MGFNLRSIDLNLIPVFEAAYEERNLTRAANRLGMTPSAMSHALNRLRVIFQDRLFDRHPKGVRPTPVADFAYLSLHNSLEAIRTSITESASFDPQASARQFHVAITHPLGPMIAVRLLDHLAQAAPGFSMRFTTLTRPLTLSQDLREGRVDLAIDWVTPEWSDCRTLALFDDCLVPMARRDHRIFEKRISPLRLSRERFVTLRPREDAPQMQTWFRPELEHPLQYVLEVSELLDVLLVVRQSSLLGVMTASMAKIAHEMFDIIAIDMPLGARARRPIQMLWHARRDNDSAHQFLRTQITHVVQGLLAANFTTQPH